jgi:O-antigen ligase
LAERRVSRQKLANASRVVAQTCSVSVLIAVYLATNVTALDRYCRWFYWGMAILCALECMLTGSRGGFISLLTAGVFAMILAGVSRRRILMIVQVLAVGLFVVILVRYIDPAALLTRVTHEQSIAEDPRYGIWMRGLSAVWKSPILGVGAGDYATATAASGERSAVAHNTFISVLVELGVIGLALYLWYTVLLFRAAWRMPRREKFLWLGVLAVWFFSANSAGSQVDKFSWFVHVMVLVQAAACLQSRPARGLFPYPNRTVPIVRGPKPPRSPNAK